MSCRLVAAMTTMPRCDLEAVHLDEQLIQRLLALFVAERVAAAAAADGVELVDEDDAGLVAAGVPEQPAHARGADAGVHLDEVGAAREEERHARLTGDRAREQRLAGAGRADEQHALRDAAAERRESLRLPQEVDDFLDLVLRLVDAGDVLERDDVIAVLGDARAAGDGRDAARRRPVDGESEEREESGDRGDRAGAERARLACRIHVDADVAEVEIVDERRVRAEEILGRHRARDGTVTQHEVDERSATVTCVTCPAATTLRNSENAMTEGRGARRVVIPAATLRSRAAAMSTRRGPRKRENSNSRSVSQKQHDPIRHTLALGLTATST